MKPHDLKAHKNAYKKFPSIPKFSPQKRNKLPKPFSKLGGPRIESTGLIEVSQTHLAFMFWRNGQTLADRSFYGYLLCRLSNGDLSPLFEFHWHPSHKGLHCKTPCNTDVDYTNRHLPGAPELAIKTLKALDPQDETDRSQL